MSFLSVTTRTGVRVRRAFPPARLVALLLACSVHAQQVLAAPGLTLAEAQQRALARSRQLPAQDASIAASRELALVAGQLPEPVLRAGIDNLPVSGDDRWHIGSDFMTMRRIGVMQEFTRADKRRLRAAQLDGAADKATAEKAVLAARIERETAIVWLDLYFAIGMAGVVREQLEQNRLALEAAEAAYRGGKGSQADVFAARAAIVAVQDRASEFDRRVKSARIMLARWVGTDAGLEPAGLPDLAHVRLDEATMEAAFAHHPEIRVLDRQEAIAQAGVRLAEANRRPDWSVEVALQQRGQGYSNMVSVGVSVPLQWDRKNRQDRELAAQLALAEQAKDEREELLRAHLADTHVLLEEWRNGRERLGRYRQELQPLAGERSAATLAAYRGARAALAEVLAARRDELDIRLQTLQLEADTARKWAQLSFLYPSGDGPPIPPAGREARP
jgi:outer membrane protein TolC